MTVGRDATDLIWCQSWKHLVESCCKRFRNQSNAKGRVHGIVLYCACCRADVATSASRLCVHSFDPLSAPCGRQEWIRKVLCFPHDLVAPELHDAHGIG